MRHAFNPTRVTFSVSDDGHSFEPVHETANVPKEGAAYSPDFTLYVVNARGRYLRLSFGASQRIIGPDTGRIALSRIRVTGLR